VRVSVIGSSGAGKTTFGRAAASRLGTTFVELDAFVYQPGWTTLPPVELRAEVERAVACDAWVIDGSYDAVCDIVFGRATTVVWLDYPKRVVMRRVVGRSLHRLLTRRVLWNGNRARLRSLVGRDHAVRRTWREYQRRRDDDASRLARPEYADLEVHRFRSPRAAQAWLEHIGSSSVTSAPSSS